MDKVIARKGLHEQQRKPDLAFWLSRPGSERIAAVEEMRREPMEAQPDFKELLGLLNANGVEYVIVGGYAVAFHGAPRYTRDLDLYVRPDPQNAERILAALSRFGFGDLGLTVRDFVTPDRVVQLGVPPVRIDFVTSIDGVPWEPVWTNRAPGTYGDVPVNYSC